MVLGFSELWMRGLKCSNKGKLQSEWISGLLCRVMYGNSLWSERHVRRSIWNDSRAANTAIHGFGRKCLSKFVIRCLGTRKSRSHGPQSLTMDVPVRTKKRRQEVEEEKSNIRLEKRFRKDDLKFFKQLAKNLLSNVGLFFLVLFFAVGGTGLGFFNQMRLHNCTILFLPFVLQELNFTSQSSVPVKNWTTQLSRKLGEV